MNLATWATRCDDLWIGRVFAMDKDVIDSSPRQIASDGKTLGQGRRHVLSTVNCELGSSLEKSFFQLFGKKPDSAAFFERPVKTFVYFCIEFEIVKALLG